METITVYKTSDGKRFDSEIECKKYENILDKVNTILKSLPNSKDYDKGCSFSNGHGYIQHSPSVKGIIEESLVKLANEYFVPKEKYTCFNYYLGRVIDDSNMNCLNKLSYKLMCIDEFHREWGQPYYAMNPDKGEQIQLNE